jgi:tripartite-type tricarboxylate transporter receptor subunit TctC
MYTLAARTRALLGALLLMPAAGAPADYPAKPVRLIVGYAPGGGTDIAARIVARRLSEQLGQQFIVDNRPGANGTIGGSLAARASADGYTLLIVTSADAINASLYARLPYDLVRDFAAVSPVASTTFVLLVHPGVAARTVQQFVELARARPGTLNYATFGSAGIPNLAVEMMKSVAGIRMEQIAYKGSGPALADLVAGQVDLMVGPMAAALPFVKAGRLRALGVAGARRNPALPEIPTLAESGLTGVVAEGWNGVLAPAAAPRERILRLNAAVGRAVGSADVTRQLVDQGYEPSTAAPAAFADFVEAEVAKWGRVVKAAGIPLQ